VAALTALIACVVGCDEDAVRGGLLGKLLNAATADAEAAEAAETERERDGGGGSKDGGGEGGGGAGGGGSRLDLNALECFRILASSDAGAAALVVECPAVIAFVATRCSSGSVDVVEAAVDVLCAMASSSDACKAAVVRLGGVAMLAQAGAGGC
jgi:hypothetical protein